MTPEELQRVREAYEALCSDGPAATLPYLHEDVVVVGPPEAPDSGTFRGHEAVRRQWDSLLGYFDQVSFEVKDLIEAGEDTALVVFTVTGRGKASGAGVEMPMAHLLTSRDGKAVHIRVFLDPGEAFRQAGLPQPGPPTAPAS